VKQESVGFCATVRAWTRFVESRRPASARASRPPLTARARSCEGAGRSKARLRGWPGAATEVSAIRAADWQPKRCRSI